MKIVRTDAELELPSVDARLRATGATLHYMTERPDQGDRRRADDAWSFLFHRVPNPGRDILNSSGTRVEDRGRERHGVVDLGDRSFKRPRHQHRGGDAQWSERPHPNRDRLRVRNVSASVGGT